MGGTVALRSVNNKKVRRATVLQLHTTMFFHKQNNLLNSPDFLVIAKYIIIRRVKR